MVLPAILCFVFFFFPDVAIVSSAFLVTVPPTRRTFIKPAPAHPRVSPSSLRAKKKKKNKGKNKGGGGGNQKKSGFEWASSFALKPFEAQSTREIASSAAASFEGRTGKPLCDDLRASADIPKALWSAPVACVVVGPSPPSPKGGEGAAEEEEEEEEEGNHNVAVKYANVAALEAVGLRPDEFERLMTPQTASGSEGVDEAVLVGKSAVRIDLPVEMKGDKKYESGYKKKILRNAAVGGGGEDITILDAHRWAIERSTLIDGKFATETVGVAYAWKEWAIGEHTVCSPGGEKREMVDPKELEEAVAAQAAAIRELKDGRGLGNKDPQVTEAVEELLRLKSMLAATTA